MEWRDTGVLLSVRRHAETSAIIDVFTESHGRHTGVVRGGTSRRIAPILQPGAQLDLTWKARLEAHIGSFTVEPIRSRAAAVMTDRLAMAGLNAVTGLLLFTLPERQNLPTLYERTQSILDLIGRDDLWPYAYLRWELCLLEEMGFALELDQCAVTGTNQDLSYVSPRTGRAISRQAAGEWADKLLPLPDCLKGQGHVSQAGVLAGLAITGHFLEHHLAASQGNRPVPEARARLVERLGRATQG